LIAFNHAASAATTGMTSTLSKKGAYVAADFTSGESVSTMEMVDLPSVPASKVSVPSGMPARRNRNGVING